MNVYLIARYGRRHELLAYAGELEGMGYTVTSRWVRSTYDMPDDLAVNPAEFNRRIAEEDYDDLLAADTVIAFAESPAPVSGRQRGGRHVELGIALASSLRVIVVGPRENVFCWLPEVEVYLDWPACRRALAVEAGLLVGSC